MSYKTKAYRKTLNGYESVSRDFISSLAKVDQIIYRDTNKPFYLEPSDDGPKLTYNTANRTFSFYPQYDGKFYGNNEESATHKYCIEELSKLNQLKVNVGKKKQEKIINFSFKYIFPEIVLPIGENWIKPDLLIYLREPSDLALRWNRILAVEIVVSHDLEGEKLELMKANKIPILRIKTNEKWGREKEENMSDKKKEELKNWIKNSFKKGYSADILLDSKSKAYLENDVISKLETKNKILFEALKKTKNHISQLDKKITDYEKIIKNNINCNNDLKINLRYKNEKLDKLKSEFKNLSDSKIILKRILTNLIFALLIILIISISVIYRK